MLPATDHTQGRPGQNKNLSILTEWAECLEAGASAFALVDMAALSQATSADHALHHIRAADGVSVLGDTGPLAARATPWLIPLSSTNGLNRKLLAASVDWASHAPCVTWLSSDQHPQVLATRLRQRTEAMLPENQPVLLRCYDPRVLPQLHDTLHPDQAHAYWALGYAWIYLDRAQHLQRIDLLPAPDTAPFEGPLILDQNQCEALLNASEVDSVMPELAKEAPDAFLALPPDQRAAFTRRCLKLADTWQLQAFAHRVMVGVLALRLGEDFHQQAAWAPWIAQLKQGKITLIQAIEKAVTP